MNGTSEMISLIQEETAEISIPGEVLSEFGEREQIRVASLLFRNMSGLLPESFPGNQTK